MSRGQDINEVFAVLDEAKRICRFARPSAQADGLDRLESRIDAVMARRTDVVANASALTFAEFSALNRARCESPDGFNHLLDSWSLSDWITALTGEVGEGANVAKKLNRVRDGIPGNSETEEELRAKFRDEVADAFIYLDLMAQSQGFTLAEVVVAKFNKTSRKLGYPVEIA